MENQTQTEVKEIVLTNESTDQDIIDLMVTSANVPDWNTNRAKAKIIRDKFWIAEHLDASGLISKSMIYEPIRRIQRLQD